LLAPAQTVSAALVSLIDTTTLDGIDSQPDLVDVIGIRQAIANLLSLNR
jgi:hypothetical protein